MCGIGIGLLSKYHQGSLFLTKTICLGMAQQQRGAPRCRRRGRRRWPRQHPFQITWRKPLWSVKLQQKIRRTICDVNRKDWFVIMIVWRCSQVASQLDRNEGGAMETRVKKNIFSFCYYLLLMLVSNTHFFAFCIFSSTADSYRENWPKKDYKDYLLGGQQSFFLTLL